MEIPVREVTVDALGRGERDEGANGPRAGSMLELSIVVPTFNELDNVDELVRRVRESLPDVQWEMIFVDDDSPDGTSERVRDLARGDPRIRCLHRIGRRGLSSACVEGMLASSASVVAVMDADLQHDESLLHAMLDTLRKERLDIVVGSRYVPGGGIGEWNETRARFSRIATALSRIVLKADLKDPMSGFFMITHDAMRKCVRNGVSGIGFKILLDLFASSPSPLAYRELPYTFRHRFAGSSKLDTTVAWEYFMMLLDKLFGRHVPVRFIAFSLVGLVGVAVHLSVLSILFKVYAISFVVAQTTATLVAMTSNFALNNVLTYRDLRLRGWKFLRGWLSFAVASSVGALANVGIASYMFQRDQFWLWSALAGIVVAAVWNYAVTAVYTWNAGRK